MKYIIGITVLFLALWLLVSTWVNRDRPFADARKRRQEYRQQRHDDRFRRRSPNDETDDHNRDRRFRFRHERRRR